MVQLLFQNVKSSLEIQVRAPPTLASFRNTSDSVYLLMRVVVITLLPAWGYVKNPLRHTLQQKSGLFIFFGAPDTPVGWRVCA